MPNATSFAGSPDRSSRFHTLERRNDLAPFQQPSARDAAAPWTRFSLDCETNRRYKKQIESERSSHDKEMKGEER
jgi:hypothetical protein